MYWLAASIGLIGRGGLRALRAAVEAARTEALRPGVVEQQIVGHVPAQICAAPEPVVRRVVVAGLTQVGPVRRFRSVGRRGARAVIGRHAEILAVETADIAAELGFIEVVVAGAGGKYQRLRDEIHVEGAERRPLDDGTGRVVEEADVVAALVRVVGRRAGPRLHIVEAVHVEGWRTGWNRLVGPLGVVIDLEFFPIQAGDAAHAPIVGRAHAKSWLW
jgi:hypothetical protein